MSFLEMSVSDHCGQLNDGLANLGLLSRLESSELIPIKVTVFQNLLPYYRLYLCTLVCRRIQVSAARHMMETIGQK